MTFEVITWGICIPVYARSKKIGRSVKTARVKEENQLLPPHRCAKYFKAPDHDASRLADGNL